MGKKSAKPAEERDIVRDGYKPEIEPPQLISNILDSSLSTNARIYGREIFPDTGCGKSRWKTAGKRV